MKLKDITGFDEFFTALFGFIFAHGIQSCLAPLDDPDRLLASLLDAELTGWNYTWPYCNIDMEYRGMEKKDTVYMLLLADTDGGRIGPDVLVDIGREGFPSFVSLSFDTDKRLPLALGLLSDVREHARHMNVEEIEKVREDGIMTMEEFRVFLNKYPRQGRLTWVEVE